MKTSTTSGLKVTKGQKKHFASLVQAITPQGVELIWEKLSLDRERVQQLLESGDEFREEFFSWILDVSGRLSLVNQFSDEEVSTSYGYFSGYVKPKSIAEQVALQQGFFPELASCTFNESFAKAPFPKGAEGPFAIPRWQVIAPTYGEAVQRVFNILERVYGGINSYPENLLDPKHLRQYVKTLHAMRRIEQQQVGNDILVIAGQFGMYHRGRSMRRAREVMTGGEFPFGLFAAGMMLLTHPERLQCHDDLWVNCAGDERGLDGNGIFDAVLVFDRDHKRPEDKTISLYNMGISNPYVSFAVPSGFSPF